MMYRRALPPPGLPCMEGVQPLSCAAMPRVHDIAVLGATPAGYAAARYLAKNNCDVVLVGAPHPASESPLADWAPGEFFQLPGLPRSLAGRCGAKGFRRVCYHNAKLDKQVQHVSRKLSGRLLPAGGLLGALRSEAADAGARFRSTSTPPSIQLQEDQVRLVGTVQVASSLLLIAHSRPHDVLGDLSLPMPTAPRSGLVVVALDVPLGASRARGLNGALHVVELPERNELGMFFTIDGTLHLRVISKSTAAGTRVEELSAMVGGLQRAGILPARLPLGRARGAVWRPPAGVALELESHVAKRCLLAGTAGGFAGSITGQTIRPSVASALLACEAALAALKAPRVQDTLMRFKAAWRKQLADCLRPPSTSLHMLLPLLFVNHNIVARFTRALLFGESI